jgi:hypothetical protein
VINAVVTIHGDQHRLYMFIDRLTRSFNHNWIWMLPRFWNEFTGYI